MLDSPGATQTYSFFDPSGPAPRTRSSVSVWRSMKATLRSRATSRTTSGYAPCVSSSVPCALNFRRTIGVNRTGVAPLARVSRDEAFEILSIRRVRSGVARGVFDLLVVVAELNEDVVARLERALDRAPLSLVDERLRAAAVHRVVVDRHMLVEEIGEQLTPAALRIRLRRRLVRHRRVADEIHVDGRLGDRADDRGDSERDEPNAHRARACSFVPPSGSSRKARRSPCSARRRRSLSTRRVSL